MLTGHTTDDWFAADLKEREAQKTLRECLVVKPSHGPYLSIRNHGANRPLLSFASNDYLGLSQHPEVKSRAIEYIEKFGAGAPSSRLVAGNLLPYEEIEAKLAKLMRTETALIFPTGYQLNSTVLPAITRKDSLIALDRLSHNSLLNGAQATRARWFRYDHNDLSQLEEKLPSANGGNLRDIWIVTESVFSMDGDVANLDCIAELAQKRKAHLYIDEAHAMGVFGTSGMGLVEKRHNADIVMGTFSKACGSSGAYVACSHIVRDYLINFCPGFIYSTALPPSVLGAIDAALDLIPGMVKERSELQARAGLFRTSVQELGFNVGNSCSQIVPLVVGSNERAVRLTQFLEEKGIFVPAIRTPTVPEHLARVRISLSTLHNDSHIEQLSDALSEWNPYDPDSVRH